MNLRKLLAGVEQVAYMNHQMPNKALQPTTATILVPESSLANSAAAAAERWR